MFVFVEMATSFHGSGSQSPTSLSRTIEKVFDESQYTGEINLSGRKLKEYPKCACKYDLVDIASAGNIDHCLSMFCCLVSPYCLSEPVYRDSSYSNSSYEAKNLSYTLLSILNYLAVAIRTDLLHAYR